MKIDFKTYVQTLGLPLEGNLNDLLTAVLNKLGYRNEDIVVKPVVRHPLLQEITFDYGVLKCDENRYGMVVSIVDEIKREELERLCGICSLTGALYGVLTNGRELVVIKPKSGVEWEYLTEIPSKVELRLELGLIEVYAIAVDYDEYESKVDDVDFVVENSRYVYSDIDRDEVVIIFPSEKLLEWFKEKDVKFKTLSDEELDDVVSKFMFL